MSLELVNIILKTLNITIKKKLQLIFKNAGYQLFFLFYGKIKGILGSEHDKEISVKKVYSDEKIGYKIREHSNSKIPIIIAIGKKEAEEKSVSVRRLGSQETKTMRLEEIKNILKQESKIPSI